MANSPRQHLLNQALVSLASGGFLRSRDTIPGTLFHGDALSRSEPGHRLGTVYMVHVERLVEPRLGESSLYGDRVERGILASTVEGTPGDFETGVRVEDTASWFRVTCNRTEVHHGHTTGTGKGETPQARNGRGAVCLTTSRRLMAGDWPVPADQLQDGSYASSKRTNASDPSKSVIESPSAGMRWGATASPRGRTGYGFPYNSDFPSLPINTLGLGGVSYGIWELPTLVTRVSAGCIPSVYVEDGSREYLGHFSTGIGSMFWYSVEAMAGSFCFVAENLEIISYVWGSMWLAKLEMLLELLENIFLAYSALLALDKKVEGFCNGILSANGIFNISGLEVSAVKT